MIIREHRGLVLVSRVRLLQINRECENYEIVMGHLGMGASSPKMRIGKRKSATSVSFRLGGVFVRK